MAEQEQDMEFSALTIKSYSLCYVKNLNHWNLMRNNNTASSSFWSDKQIALHGMKCQWLFQVLTFLTCSTDCKLGMTAGNSPRQYSAPHCRQTRHSPYFCVCGNKGQNSNIASVKRGNVSGAVSHILSNTHLFTSQNKTPHLTWHSSSSVRICLGKARDWDSRSCCM